MSPVASPCEGRRRALEAEVSLPGEEVGAVDVADGQAVVVEVALARVQGTAAFEGPQEELHVRVAGDDPPSSRRGGARRELRQRPAGNVSHKAAGSFEIAADQELDGLRLVRAASARAEERRAAVSECFFLIADVSFKNCWVNQRGFVIASRDHSSSYALRQTCQGLPLGPRCPGAAPSEKGLEVRFLPREMRSVHRPG